MNLINELRMLAEDLHVNGYNRYSAAMSNAADELDKWEAIFGHLGGTPDECGNAIIAARDELEERTSALKARCIASVCAAKTARAVIENAAALLVPHWRNRNDPAALQLRAPLADHRLEARRQSTDQAAARPLHSS